MKKIISKLKLVILCVFFGLIAGCEEDQELVLPPAIETQPVSNVLGISASSGGTIVSDGGDFIVERGI